MFILGVALLTPTSLYAESSGNYEAKFNKNGEMIRPDGWREWVFVGSPTTPNSLNGGAAPFPEFHSVYIDPQSWAHWKKTGTFREGTMFAKELSTVGDTKATSGNGFFNGEMKGFEIAHKDSKRYSKDSDGWAYYSFGHKAEPYNNSLAPKRPRVQNKRSCFFPGLSWGKRALASTTLSLTSSRSIFPAAIQSSICSWGENLPLFVFATVKKEAVS
jgi:hypothetical protein